MYVFPIMYQCVKTQLGEKKNMLHTCGCRGTVVKLNLAVTGQVTSGKIHDKVIGGYRVLPMDCLTYTLSLKAMFA